MAESIGGEAVTSTSAVQLSTDDSMLAQLTIFTGTFGDSTDIVGFGGSDVTSAANRHGLLKTGDKYTFGPFSRGGVRASDIYIVSTAAADEISWNGVPA